MHKIFVGASSFAQASKDPLQFLENNDCEVILNPYKRKLIKDELIECAKDCDGLLAGLEKIDQDVISQLPKLKAVTRIGIGTDNVDKKALQDAGIKFNFTPDPPTKAVGELTLTMALALSRRIFELNSALHNGEWKKIISSSLMEKNVLIVGGGRIGSYVANLFKPLVKSVSIFDPFIEEYSHVPLETMLKNANILSVHASGSKEIIDSKLISLLPEGAIILNSSRGGVVSEDGICDAIDSGKLAGAWLDVFTSEPYSGRMISYPNIVLTPHVCTYTKECRLSMEMEAAKKILGDLNG